MRTLSARTLAARLGLALTFFLCSASLSAPSSVHAICTGLCDDDEITVGGDWPAHPVMGQPYCDTSDYPSYFLQRDHTEVRTVKVGSKPGKGHYIKPGVLVTHVKAVQWCENDEGGRSKVKYFWLPLVSEDGIVYFFNLLAEVEGQLAEPVIKWTNKDLEYDWLWVNIEHFATLEPIDDVYVEQSAGDEFTGTARAWLRAEPTKFKIDIPGAEDSEGVVSCDLQQITRDEGCGIIFRHASSISPSGTFDGTLELEWTVSSNSDRYRGVVFTTEGQFTTTVAEAMGVSR